MGAPEAMPMQITLQLDDAMRRHLAEAEGIVEIAESFIIDCAEVAQAANTELREIKARRVRIETMKKDFVRPAKEIIANAEKWFDPSLEAHERAEQILKQRLGAWTAEQQRLADERRRQAEAEARRLRLEAEQKAAAERARAEAAAAEARRKAEEAAERERRAREEGNARAAAAAAAERAKREEEERQRLAEGERKAQEAELVAAAAPTPHSVSELQKVDGFSMRKNWISELADDTPTVDQALEKIVAAIAGVPVITGRRDLLSLLTLDMKAANRLAKAQEKNFSVPGLKARNAPIATSRG